MGNTITAKSMSNLMRTVSSKLSEEQLAQIRAVHAELQSAPGRMPKASLGEAAVKCGFDEAFLPDSRELDEISARVSKSVPEDAPEEYIFLIDVEDFIAVMLALQVLYISKVLETAFKEIDGDGYIVSSEIDESLKKKGWQLSSEQIEEVMKSGDQDKDGKISYDEFVAAVLS